MERKRIDNNCGACFLCPARVWNKYEGIYVCDQSKFQMEGLGGKMRIRPMYCPENKGVITPQLNVYAFLRYKLRNR